MSFNEGDSNSIITNYYQYGPGTFRTLVTIEILLVSLQCLAYIYIKINKYASVHSDGINTIDYS